MRITIRSKGSFEIYAKCLTVIVSMRVDADYIEHIQSNLPETAHIDRWISRYIKNDKGKTCTKFVIRLNRKVDFRNKRDFELYSIPVEVDECGNWAEEVTSMFEGGDYLANFDSKEIIHVDCTED